MLEWLANHYKEFGCLLEFVTDRSEEGNQFCKGFGGIGGVLRYSVSDCGRASERNRGNRRAGVVIVRTAVLVPTVLCPPAVPACHSPFVCAVFLLIVPFSSLRFLTFLPCQVDLTEFEEPDDTGGDALWSEEEDFF